MGKIGQMVTDFISEKCQDLVDYVLELFGSFSEFIQAGLIVVGALLILIGTIAVIKKSAKIIVFLAAVLVIGFVIWTFI